MTVWIVVALAGAGSYALRVVPLFAAGVVADRPGLQRALDHALPAVLAAMVVSGVVHHDAGGRPLDAVAVAASLAGAALLARRQAPMLGVVAGGFATYWLVTAAVAVVAGVPAA